VSSGGQVYVGVFNSEDPDPANMIASTAVPVSGTTEVSVPYTIDLGNMPSATVLVIGFYDANNNSDPDNGTAEDDWPDYGDVIGSPSSNPIDVGGDDITGIHFPISTTYAGTSGYSLYDDFTATDNFFDVYKWFSLYNPHEDIRKVKAGQLVSGVRSTTGGEQNKTLINNPDPSTQLSRLKADVIIDSIDSGRDTDSSVFTRIDSAFYNSESTSPSTPLGDVWASLGVWSEDGELVFYYQIKKCTDSQGSSWEQLEQKEIPLSGVALGELYKLEIIYDKDQNSLTFKVYNNADEVLKTIIEDSLPANQGPAYFNNSCKLVTGTSNQNPGLVLCHIFVKFDNVYLNGVLHDNFDVSDTLDPAKWNSPEIVKVIENEKALLLSSSNGSTETVRLRTRRPLANTRVEVEIDSDSQVVNGAFGRVRLEGVFYNDTFGKEPGGTYNGDEGEVWAQVGLDLMDDDTLVAKYTVVRTNVADTSGIDPGIAYSIPLDGTFSVFTGDNAIQKGRKYQLGINFTGTQLIFSCTDLGSSVPYTSQTVTYDIPVAAYTPHYVYRALASRIYGSSQTDAGGTMIGRF